MPLKATERSSLVGRVIDQLRGQIESGEWPVGTKIPAEPVLVQSLGVGRNTVREAIRALVHSGMLEPLQGDGTYVRAGDDLGAAVLRRLRRAGQLEALEVRSSLERDAARLAAARRTDADIEALRAALARRDAAWREGDDEQLISADLHFHRVAVAAAHNGMLADLYDYLTEGLRAVLETIVHSPLGEEVRYQRGSHAALVEAIEAGDQEVAQRCVEDYLLSAVESVRLLSDADQ
ncbi:MAG TPA: FCD domain-containing protein [Pseudonocardia sp.]|uniref:FadR/GntR family transcriptional regulator n=1 Tax=Pseudonocardia sp. TaxID=60912 RepID=UPI002C332D96|nr:FCD domain-containing protein [Pseudonocardia sp.]HTF53721.1 FCD domain-containing protein [Pseudonocardia sp.]